MAEVLELDEQKIRTLFPTEVLEVFQHCIMLKGKDIEIRIEGDKFLIMWEIEFQHFVEEYPQDIFKTLELKTDTFKKALVLLESVYNSKK